MIIKYLLYLFICLFLNLNNNYHSISYDIEKDYYFNLDIPKINLYVNVYRYNDSRNHVDKGIYLAKDFSFNKVDGALVLASHSGNSSISHFKHLNLLRVDDIVKISNNDIEYIYLIDNYYKISKNGKFKYINDDKYIYLITCDKKNKHKQLVCRAKLYKIVKKSTFF